MIQEKVKVFIVDDGTEKSSIVKVMVQACDDIIVLGGPVQSNVYEFKNYHQEPIDIRLRKPAVYGEYRKFIKRDKRKNFR